jgi:hypothetical protein
MKAGLIPPAILADIDAAIVEMMHQLQEKHPDVDIDCLDAYVTERVALTIGRMFDDEVSAKKNRRSHQA